MRNMNALMGSHDFLFITLDTLRYDVAQQLFCADGLPHFARVLPDTGWEKRHTPASFTYAAHQAFFAGFLPTPTPPGNHARLFALDFPGSETTVDETLVFHASNIIEGFKQKNYYTVCVGGVGFFNNSSPLGAVLPGLFDEDHWSPELGVTDKHSTAKQVDLILKNYGRWKSKGRLFLFLNVSAVHQPNCHYVPGQTRDNKRSQAAALQYVDQEVGRLFYYLRNQGPTFVIVCSDHGTTYGDDGYYGHRLAHQAVWDVPYTDFVLV